MHRTNVPRAIAAVTIVLLLSACASVPLPLDVDLKAKMPADSAEGTVTERVRAGETAVVDLRLPSQQGECVDFADVAPESVTVRSAQLQWVVDATYDGPDLSGMVQARAFVAGEGDEVFDPAHTLGPVFTLNLDKTSTRLAGAAVLNPTQLEAVNDRKVCWGVEVTGRDLAAAEDGTATVRYSVEKLRLRITFSVL